MDLYEQEIAQLNEPRSYHLEEIAQFPQELEHGGTSLEELKEAEYDLYYEPMQSHSRRQEKCPPDRRTRFDLSNEMETSQNFR